MVYLGSGSITSENATSPQASLSEIDRSYL
jgi:hypothetical protein